ncbi:Cytochrome P450 81C13 [Linum perenne]
MIFTYNQNMDTFALKLPYLTIIFLFVFSFISIKILKPWIIKHPQVLPPSPLAFPIIGHLHLLKPPLYKSFHTLTQRYGPILFFKLGCRSLLVLSSPSAVEECFTKNDVVFANRPKSISSDYFTYNYRAYVWAPYGHFWRSIRRLIVTEIFSPKTLHRSALVREEEVRSLLRRLHKDKDRAVNLKFLLSLLTVNVMMRLAVGRRCVEEEEGDTEVEKVKYREFKGTFLPGLGMNICDYVPFLRKIGFGWRMEKHMLKMRKKRDDYLQGLVDEVVNKRIGSQKIGSKGADEVKSVAEIILSLRESDPDFYIDDVLNSTIVMMFVAGTETASITLEWAMALLLDNPRVMNKLKIEIDNTIGNGRLMNEQDIPKLPYLKCVINETLRLYPPAPLLLPHCSSDSCTVEGYQIPKDTTLMVNMWAMQRDPKLWKEADKFVPERFEEELNDHMKDSEEGGSYKYAPFGMGRRSCPGAGLGFNLVSLTLGSLVQCFEWHKVGTEVEDIAMFKNKPLEAKCSSRCDLVKLLSLV